MTTQSTFIPKSWDRLIRPYKVSFEKMDTTYYLETVVVEPLERGFGMTLGNALRRVLMSSIQGTAGVFQLKGGRGGRYRYRIEFKSFKIALAWF
jgi:hypothetical protein